MTSANILRILALDMFSSLAKSDLPLSQQTTTEKPVQSIVVDTHFTTYSVLIIQVLPSRLSEVLLYALRVHSLALVTGLEADTCYDYV